MFRIPRHWDPWRELEQLRSEMNRLWAGSGYVPHSEPAELPAVNVWRGNHGVTLTAELPGLDPQDLDITVTTDSVTISGDRPAEQLKEGESYHRRERATEPFSRTLELPFEVNPQQAEAIYEKGILMLRLHRPEEQKSRKIRIRPA